MFRRLCHAVSLLLATSLVVTACASSRTTWKSYEVTPPTLAASAADADIDALAEKVYGVWGEGDFALVETQVAGMLQKHPTHGKLHEMAGYLARLNGDNDRAWQHFAQAAQDTSSDVTRLYLYELTHAPLLVSQTMQSLALVEKLAAEHPDPLVQHQANLLRVSFLHKLGRLDEARAVSDELDVLDNFMLLGAFDNDQGKGFLTQFSPEKAIKLDEEVDGRRVRIRWRKAFSEPFGRGIALGKQVSPASHSVAYLATWLHVDADVEAVLRLSTLSPTKAFVNGAEVMSVQTLDDRSSDNLAVAVQLKKGANLLLLKSAHESGGWLARVRVTAPDGSKLVGLTSSTTPAKTPLVKQDKKPSMLDMPAGLFAAPASARTSFLKARALRMDGFYRDAADTLDNDVDRARGNLLTLYERALLFWDTEESGKAIDLLNAGVDASGGEAEAFLIKRARFFRNKKQWEKSLDDLRAVVAQQPNAFTAHMALGGLFEDRGWDIDRCRQYQMTMQQWPASAYAKRELARCLDERGYEAEAQQLFEDTLALEPGHVWNLRRLRDMAINRHDLEEGWRYQQRILAQLPTSGSAKLRAASLLRRMHRTDEAMAYLDDALAQDPDWASPLRRKGDLLYELDDKEGAAALWRASLDRDPDNAHLADHVDFVSPEGLGKVEPYIPSEDAIAKAVSSSKSIQPMRGANVVFLMDHEVTEVQQDGSAKAVVTLVQLAVNKKGRDALIKKGIPTDGKVKLRAAYSVAPDGTRQEASSIRGGSLRYRNVEAGTVTVLQYVHYRPPPAFLPNHYVSKWFFEGIHQQYNDSTWVLIAPKARYLHVDKHDAISLDEKVDGDVKVRTFHRGGVAPLIPERGMPPLIDLLASVSVSTVESWDEYVKWERALLANAFNSNPELEALSKKLVGDAQTTREKFDRLFHYVAQEIRYQQDYENTIAGVRPHSCPQVLARGYGDCKDKAVLLILLAKHAGVDVDFAILRTTGAGKVQQDVPNQQFNHAIVYVPKQEGIDDGFFMDPTTDGLDMGNLRADDQGAISLVLDPDTGNYKFHTIPLQDASLDFEKHNIVVDIDKDLKATAVDNIALRGRWGAGVRRIVRDEESAKKLFERLGNILFPGATYQSGEAKDAENIYTPLALTLKLDVSNSVQPQGDERRVRLPIHFPLTQTAQSAERRFALRLGIHAHAETRVEVKLPAGAKTTFLPPDFEVKHDCFTASRKTEEKKSKDGTVVVATYNYEQTCFEVTTEQYPSYREAVRQVHGHLQDRLSFRPGNAQMALWAPEAHQ